MHHYTPNTLVFFANGVMHTLEQDFTFEAIIKFADKVLEKEKIYVLKTMVMKFRLGLI